MPHLILLKYRIVRAFKMIFIILNRAIAELTLQAKKQIVTLLNHIKLKTA